MRSMMPRTSIALLRIVGDEGVDALVLGDHEIGRFGRCGGSSELFEGQVGEKLV